MTRVKARAVLLPELLSLRHNKRTMFRDKLEGMPLQTLSQAVDLDQTAVRLGARAPVK